MNLIKKWSLNGCDVSAPVANVPTRKFKDVRYSGGDRSVFLIIFLRLRWRWIEIEVVSPPVWCLSEPPVRQWRPVRPPDAVFIKARDFALMSVAVCHSPGSIVSHISSFSLRWNYAWGGNNCPHGGRCHGTSCQLQNFGNLVKKPTWGNRESRRKGGRYHTVCHWVGHNFLITPLSYHFTHSHLLLRYPFMSLSFFALLTSLPDAWQSAYVINQIFFLLEFQLISRFLSCSESFSNVGNGGDYFIDVC